MFQPTNTSWAINNNSIEKDREKQKPETNGNKFQ